MDKKRNLLIIGILGGVIALVWCAVAAFAFNKWRTANQGTDVVVIEIVSCDADASGLCVTSFGVDNINRMVINFHLPKASFAKFYVKARHGEDVSVYPCEVVTDAPTNVFCTGARTPLGEAIDIEVYTTSGDVLIARGMLVVAAVALPTTVNVSATPTGRTETPSGTLSTLTPATPFGATPTPTIFSTPVFRPTFTPTVGVYSNP